MTNWQKYGMAAAIVAAAVLLWYEMLPAKKPVGEWQPANDAPQVEAVPKTEITPPKVTVYTAPAKKRLNLPAAVQDDPHAHVIDSTRVKADEHPETVTTVIDDQTGQTETLIRKEPLPWLAAEQRGELWMGYGIKNGGAKVARLAFREDFVQVKAMHGGVEANLDSDGTLFLGAGVAYRW